MRLPAITLTLIYLLCLPYAAANEAEPTDAKLWDRSYDAVMSVDVDVLPKFLTYPESRLGPVERLSVRPQKMRSSLILRGIKSDAEKSQMYEQLWYHDGKAVGMKRFKDLPVNPDDQVAIYFRSREAFEVCHQARAVANCVLRLTLDIALHNGIMAAAIVPEQCIDDVADAMRAYNFARIDSATPHRNDLLTLRLLSYDGKVERYLYHCASDK